MLASLSCFRVGASLNATSSSHSPHAHRPDGHREVYADSQTVHHSQLYPSGLQCKHQGSPEASGLKFTGLSGGGCLGLWSLQTRLTYASVS